MEKDEQQLNARRETMKQITVNRIAFHALKKHATGGEFKPSSYDQVNEPELDQWSFEVSDALYAKLSEVCNPLDIDEVSKVIVRQCNKFKRKEVEGDSGTSGFLDSTRQCIIDQLSSCMTEEEVHTTSTWLEGWICGATDPVLHEDDSGYREEALGELARLRKEMLERIENVNEDDEG